MALIDGKKVNELVVYCLVKDSDHIDCERLPDEDVVIVNGIVNTFVFHKKRLESIREEVVEMTNNLNYMNNTISFLDMCADKNGEYWGQHSDCEALLCLAIGLTIYSYLLPQECWGILPGGVPYVKLNNKEDINNE